MKPGRLFLSPPHMSGAELSFVQEAFASNYIAPLGPMVDAFEQEFSEYTGIGCCVALASGTAAMHLVLRYIGVGPGDEVLASTLTFIGSVSPVTFLGAAPVFIDCDRTSWNMDPNLLETELKRCAGRGRLPRAVIPTDLYGQCADYDRIRSICDRYDIPVIVDAAEAMGARYMGAGFRVSGFGGALQQVQGERPCGPGSGLKIGAMRHAGKGAYAAVFSFNGNKIMTTSGGGMLGSDNPDLIQKARFWSQQARDPFPHYEHSTIGYNYRMSNVLAAIGRGQLTVLEERVRRRREIFDFYQNALGDLPGIEFMPEATHGRCNRWLTVVLISPERFGCDREAVRLALEAENIESRPVWKPMHLQPVFRDAYPCRVVGGLVAGDLFDRGLCLPSGTQLTEEDLDRIAGVIRRTCTPKPSG